MTYTLTDFFCGAGGSSQGASAVPGVEVRLAANHWDRAIESHAANFPATEHFQGDLHDYDVAKFPRTDGFWASPECIEWTGAKGNHREFDKQPDLFGETLPPDAADRSRALMWDVPRYLDAMKLRGKPVLFGVVENVVEARESIHWAEWVKSIQNLGYKTKLVALNSMHARPVRTPWAPQSRDRLYFLYWLDSIPEPDWNKWLRPQAWCPSCDEWVAAVQVWKKPGRDMGRYRTQYVYRCPRLSCRGLAVEPPVLPAAAVINWSVLGQRIGDRDRPLAPKTIARIEAGLRKYAVPVTVEASGDLACLPMVVPAGGTWNDDARPVGEPIRTRTGRENDALATPPFVVPMRSGRNRSNGVDEPLATVAASGNHHGLVCPPFLTIMRGRSVTQEVSDPLGTVTSMGAHHGLVCPPFMTVHRGGDLRTVPVDQPMPTQTASSNAVGVAVPLLVPVEGRDGKEAIPVTGPHRTQTGRAETGLATPALIMRNNTSRSGDGSEMCTPADEPLRTLTAKGHQSLITWQEMARHLLVPYYGTGVARPAADPVGTLSARDRYGLASPAIDVDDVMFRMLEPGEIGGAMAFYPYYIVLGSKREQVRQFGNAVTPPASEIIISALVEAISGESLERA